MSDNFTAAMKAANEARDNTSLDPYVRDDAEISALRMAVAAAASLLGIEVENA